ncbi:MAG: shikimate kinase [Bacillota bacterium]|nr:shikimate kinase [Bacillota bacterium]
MNNIVLIGMPGVGKSTIGVILAKITGRTFIDTDLLIQEQQGKLLKDIIAHRGVEGFLAIEDQVLASIKTNNAVIATGGSAVYGKNAMAHLKEGGTIVYLKLDIASLSRRLSNIKNRGVVYKEGQTLEDIFAERCQLYEKYADITIEEGSHDPETVIEKLLIALAPLNKG